MRTVFLSLHLLPLPPSLCLPPSLFFSPPLSVSLTLSSLSPSFFSLHSPQSWIEHKKMGAFLGVAQGATTSPWLLEMQYNYKPGNTPIVLVGKGIIKRRISRHLLIEDISLSSVPIATFVYLTTSEMRTPLY